MKHETNNQKSKSRRSRFDKKEELTTLVEGLSGCILLKNVKNHKRDYADYLLEKYSKL